jgi:hypothetical protein
MALEQSSDPLGYRLRKFAAWSEGPDVTETCTQRRISAGATARPADGACRWRFVANPANQPDPDGGTDEPLSIAVNAYLDTVTPISPRRRCGRSTR